MPRQPARITDYGFYNRGRFQRNEAIHPMADVAMSFRIEDIHGRGLLWLQATDGRDEFMVQIDPGDEKYIVLKNRRRTVRRRPSPRATCPVRCAVRRSRSRFSTGSSSCRSPGGPWLRPNIDTPGPPPLADQPLAIGAEGLGVVVDRLRVYRDVYYTEPPFAGTARQSRCVFVRPGGG